MRPDPTADWTGRRLGGRYTVRRLVGTGGMGAVYEATHDDLGRRVALKLLYPHLALRDDSLVRFRREALDAAALGHPNIVAVSDFVHADGEPPFIVMEYLEGRTVEQAIKASGPMSPQHAVSVAMQVLSALEAAHGSGIIHRDLKPANVFLTPIAGVGEVAKVLDFGVAKHHGADVSRLTRSGELIGTLSYMAPEQARSQPVTAATDVYAVGATMYFALTGRAPFIADSQWSLLMAVSEGNPTSLQQLRPDLDPALVAVVSRAMAADPAARFATATQMRDALQHTGLARAVVRPSPPAFAVASAPAVAPPGGSWAPPTGAATEPGGPAATVPTASSWPGAATGGHGPTASPPPVSPPARPSTPARSLVPVIAIVGVLAVAAIGTAGWALIRSSRSEEVPAADVAPTPAPPPAAPPPAAPPPAAPPTVEPAPEPPPPVAPAAKPATDARPGLFSNLLTADDDDEDAPPAKPEAPEVPDQVVEQPPPVVAPPKPPPKRRRVKRSGLDPSLGFINANALYTTKAVRAGYQARKSVVVACLRKHQFDPDKHDRFDYRLSIDKTGRITRVRIHTTTKFITRSPKFDACMFGALKKLSFGPFRDTAPAGGGEVILSFTAPIR